MIDPVVIPSGAFASSVVEDVVVAVSAELDLASVPELLAFELDLPSEAELAFEPAVFASVVDGYYFPSPLVAVAAVVVLANS